MNQRSYHILMVTIILILWNEMNLSWCAKMRRKRSKQFNCKYLCLYEEKDTRHNKDANYAFWITITKALASGAAAESWLHNKFIKKYQKQEHLFKRSLHISLHFCILSRSFTGFHWFCVHKCWYDQLPIRDILFAFAHFQKHRICGKNSFCTFSQCDLIKIFLSSGSLSLSLYPFFRCFSICKANFYLGKCALICSRKKITKLHISRPAQALTFWFLSSIPFLFCAVFELA